MTLPSVNTGSDVAAGSFVAADSIRAVGNDVAVSANAVVGSGVAAARVGAIASVGAIGAACDVSPKGSCVGAQAKSRHVSRANAVNSKVCRTCSGLNTRCICV